MSTWDVARANAAVLTYQVQKPNTETTGNVAKYNDPAKSNKAETTGAVAFDNGIYSSCQSGHFEAAA